MAPAFSRHSQQTDADMVRHARYAPFSGAIDDAMRFSESVWKLSMGDASQQEAAHGDVYHGF